MRVWKSSVLCSLLLVTVLTNAKFAFKQNFTSCCFDILDGSYSQDCFNVDDAPAELITGAIQGPHLRVGIVTYVTDSIMDYARYSLFVNALYGAYNGYTVRVRNRNSTTRKSDPDPRWNKVSTLIDALDPNTGWARYYDYLLWVDADLIFVNFTLRLEKIAADFPEAHILLCSEMYGLNRMNSGSVFVRNSAWTRNFLLDWWYYGDRAKNNDQTQFDLLYQSRSNDFKKRIKFLSTSALNSDHLPGVTHVAGKSVLHLMGMKAAVRRTVFRRAVAVLCACPSALPTEAPLLSSSSECTQSSSTLNSDIPVQLGLTREYVAEVSLQLTTDRLSAVLNSVAEHLADGMVNDDSLLQSFIGSAALFSSWITLFRNRPGDVVRAYDILFEHFSTWLSLLERVWDRDQAIEAEPQCDSSPRQECPAPQKHVYTWILLLEMGVHLLAFPQTISVFWTNFPSSYHERHVTVVQRLPVLAHRILLDLPRAQFRQPSEIALFHKIAGRMQYWLNDTSQSLLELQQSLSIYRKLSDVYGEHIIATSISIDLARTHSALGNYSVASKYFNYSITWIENNAGSNHFLLADILFAYCKVLHQRHVIDGTERVSSEEDIYHQIRALLTRSVGIYKLYKYPWFYTEYGDAVSMLAEYN